MICICIYICEFVLLQWGHNMPQTWLFQHCQSQIPRSGGTSPAMMRISCSFRGPWSFLQGTTPPISGGAAEKNGKRYKSLDILKNKWHSMTMWPWDIPYECKLCVVWWFLEYQGIYVTVYVHHAVHICRYLQCASTRSPRHLSTSLTEPNSQSSMTFVWQSLWVKWSRFNMTQPHPTWVWGHTPITISADPGRRKGERARE